MKIGKDLAKLWQKNKVAPFFPGSFITRALNRTTCAVSTVIISVTETIIFFVFVNFVIMNRIE